MATGNAEDIIMTKRLIQNKISNRSLAEIAFNFMGSGMYRDWKPIAERRVARFGGDTSVAIAMNNHMMLDSAFHHGKDLMSTTGLIINLFKKCGSESPEKTGFGNSQVG